MFGKGWMTSFIDMLMLLFTFLVFIIAISRFKGDTEIGPADYPLVEGSLADSRLARHIKGTAIELIKGLKTPRIPDKAQKILTEMAMAAQAGTYKGINMVYNESKISLIFPDQLTFVSGSSSLDGAAGKVLKDLVVRLANSPYPISIEGHTDTSVNEKYDNIDLSLNRALSVAKYLVENGLPLSKISVSGYGPHRPIADNSNPDTKGLNRRVEIHIMFNEEIL